MSAPPDDQADDAARWYVLAASALGSFAASVMFTSVNVAIPTLVEAFDTKFAVVQWVLLAYLLATSALLPILGRLADMVGKRTIFLGGFALYIVGSLLSGLAGTVALLIAFRTLQGVGAAVLTAIGLAIVTDVFPSNERGRAIGINGAVLSTGIVIGPTLGGLLIDVASWRWVFWSGVPVGMLGMLLSYRFVPKYRGSERRRFDFWGAGTLFASLFCLSLALTLGQERAFDDPVILALFTGFAIVLALFLWIEKHAEAPVLELSLFTNRALTVGLVAGFATFIAIAGTIFLMPFYLENILGYSPRNVGLLMSVVPIVLVFIAPIAGTLADRHGERIVAVFGLILILIGYIAITTLDENTTALGYVLRFLPIGFGMGIFQTPNNSAIMGAVERTKSGVAGGLLALTRTLGQTVGIAVLGSLWAARVSVRAATPVGAEATSAPATAQVGGLHDMLYVVIGIIACALALSIWDLRHRRMRSRRSAAAAD